MVLDDAVTMAMDPEAGVDAPHGPAVEEPAHDGDPVAAHVEQRPSAREGGIVEPAGMGAAVALPVRHRDDVAEGSAADQVADLHVARGAKHSCSP